MEAATMLKNKREDVIDKMIRISKEKPLLPEKFIPWEAPIKPKQFFLPAGLISIAGHAAYENLADTQKMNLSKLEAAQVIYSYAWSESLACIYFNRRIMNISTQSQEYRFLLRELIEEFRHQDMFLKVIDRMGVSPVEASGLHKWIGIFSTRFLPDSFLYISILTIEQMADIYGDEIRKDVNGDIVMKKAAELHHIEEARHMYFAKYWLEQYTGTANLFLKSLYNLVALCNILFMLTLYFQKVNFANTGGAALAGQFKPLKRYYYAKFARQNLSSIVDWIESWDGFNPFTKWIWKSVFKTNF